LSDRCYAQTGKEEKISITLIAPDHAERARVSVSMHQLADPIALERKGIEGKDIAREDKNWELTQIYRLVLHTMEKLSDGNRKGKNSMYVWCPHKRKRLDWCCMYVIISRSVQYFYSIKTGGLAIMWTSWHWD
jgi:hypothetical protein